MKVVTVATDLQHPFLEQLLIPSCIRAELDLVVLKPRRRWRTFADKRRALTRYLERRSERDEVVLFTDAYDAVLLRGPDQIGATHRALGGGVVFSGEVNCWPLGSLGQSLYDSVSGPHPYLNSGGFIGTADELLALLRRYRSPPSDRFEALGALAADGRNAERRFGWSDQYYWTLVYLLEPRSVTVDAQSRLFECFAAPLADVERDIDQLEFRGRDQANYLVERERLIGALSSERFVAHLHFASSIAKTVALDLFTDGLMPSWIADAIGPRADVSAPRVRVCRV